MTTPLLSQPSYPSFGCAPIHTLVPGVSGSRVIECHTILGQLTYYHLAFYEHRLQLLIPIHSLAVLFLKQFPERLHDGGCSKEWCQLVHKSEPRPDVLQGRLNRHAKIPYCCQPLIRGLVSVPAQVKPHKLHLSTAKLELLWLECDAFAGTNLQHVT